MNLEHKLEQQIRSGDIAGAYKTKQEIKFQMGLTSKQSLRDAAVRSVPKPAYISDFDSFLAEVQGEGRDKRSSVNIKGHSTVASPRGLSGSMEVVNQNSINNLI